jgi:hypothetical protein
MKNVVFHVKNNINKGLVTRYSMMKERIDAIIDYNLVIGNKGFAKKAKKSFPKQKSVLITVENRPHLYKYVDNLDGNEIYVDFRTTSHVSYLYLHYNFNIFKKRKKFEEKNQIIHASAFISNCNKYNYG